MPGRLQQAGRRLCPCLNGSLATSWERKGRFSLADSTVHGVFVIFILPEAKALTTKGPVQRTTERLGPGAGPWDWYYSMDEEADAQQKALSSQMFTAVPGEGSVKNFQDCMAGVWRGGAGFSTIGCSRDWYFCFFCFQDFKNLNAKI